MLAYHPYWLEALQITREAKDLTKRGLISAEQYRIIRAAFTTPLYAPNILERITLFLFTTACLSGPVLFVWRETGAAALPLVVLGALCFAALEFLVRSRKVYRAGIDEALLYSGVLLTTVGAWRFFDASFQSVPIGLWALVLPLLVTASIRYADRLCAVAAFGSVLALIWALHKELLQSGAHLLPFILMALSVLCYATCKRVRHRKELASWGSSFEWLMVASLFFFYLAGNVSLFRAFIDPSVASVPMQTFPLTTAGFYNAFVLLCPVCYVVGGLVFRNRSLLRVGLMVEGVTLFTLRTTTPVVPLDHTFIILGASLILMTVVFVQLLKSNTSGLTHREMEFFIRQNPAVETRAEYDRLAAQHEAVKIFETGDSSLSKSGARLGW